MPVLESPKEIGVDSPGPGVGKGAWLHTPYLIYLSMPCCTCAFVNAGSYQSSYLSWGDFGYLPLTS